MHRFTLTEEKLRRTYDISPAHLLIVAPTDRELGGMRTRRLTGVDVAVVGLGRAAGGALRTLVERRPPSIVLSLGFAGSLTDGPKTGTLVVSRRVVDADGHEAPAILDARYVDATLTALADADVTAIEGDLLTVPAPLLSSGAKREQGARTRAVAVDMEGYWLVCHAHEAGIPVVSVRAIIDEVGHDLPTIVKDIVADGGRREWLHALKAMRNPVTASALVPLARRSRRAGQALQVAAQVLAPAFTKDARLRGAYR
jgi:nucleoside phosphorylase